MPPTRKQQPEGEENTEKAIGWCGVKQENVMLVLGRGCKGLLLDEKGEESSWGSE